MDAMERRTLFRGISALGGAMLASPSVAQPARTATLRFVPQANLTALDPIWTSAIVTQMHGYHVYDTLYAVDGQLIDPAWAVLAHFGGYPDPRR
jgi:peptide/nickel transport system substrate-binding protein